MGMYLTLAKKEDESFESVHNLWDDSKWSNRSEMFNCIVDNGFSEFYYGEIYYRPNDFESCYKFAKKLGVNKGVFLKLLKVLEKDKNLYVTYN